MAYDRLLERLYLADSRWIVKGAVALLARGIGVRATAAIDLYREPAGAVADADLRLATAARIGDWFRFEIHGPRPLAGTGGVRLPVTAFVGDTVWAAFHAHLAGPGVRLTGEPEHVPPLTAVVMPDVAQHGYRAYPLADHVADKVCAMFERHGAAGAPSTRYKDLVDIVAIVLSGSVSADPQIAALRSEAGRRGLRLPDRLVVPDRALWKPGYAAEAARSLLSAARTLDGALAAAGPFLDPLLNGTARGTWHPRGGRWAS
jgi:hypothetical protein